MPDGGVRAWDVQSLVQTFLHQRSVALASTRALLAEADTAAPTKATAAAEALTVAAAWLREASERIPALMAGAPARTYDCPGFTAAAIAADSGRPLDQALGGFLRAADRFAAIAADLKDEALEEEPDVHAWLVAIVDTLIPRCLAQLEQTAGM